MTEDEDEEGDLPSPLNDFELECEPELRPTKEEEKHETKEGKSECKKMWRRKKRGVKEEKKEDEEKEDEEGGQGGRKTGGGTEKGNKSAQVKRTNPLRALNRNNAWFGGMEIVKLFFQKRNWIVHRT